MKYIIAAILAGFLTIAATWNPQSKDYSDKDTVQSIIEQLDGPKLPHSADLSMPGVSVEKGMELLTTGITTNDKNRKTKKQSTRQLIT